MGDRPWGTHFCNFYESRKDLLDMLVLYFKAGLEDSEFCVWVVSEPLSEQEVWDGLREAVPEFDHYLSKRSIEVFDGRAWYLKGGAFDLIVLDHLENVVGRIAVVRHWRFLSRKYRTEAPLA